MLEKSTLGGHICMDNFNINCTNYQNADEAEATKMLAGVFKQVVFCK